jgi:uncharacterized protein (DUF433 family)
MAANERDDQDLIERFIELDPSGGCVDARAIGYAVPVWVLVGYWPANGRDTELVAKDYELPREGVQAALAFFERHTEIIDARIQANIVRTA